VLKRARRGASYASVASPTGRWLADRLARLRAGPPQRPSQRDSFVSRQATFAPLGLGRGKPGGIKYAITGALSPGDDTPRPQRRRAAGSRATHADQRPREDISKHELALFLGLRAPHRGARRRAPRLLCARGVTRERAFGSSERLSHPARVPIVSGVLNCAKSHPGAGGLRRERSDLSLGLACGADGDRFTTAPTQHARGHRVAGSPAGSLLSAAPHQARRARRSRYLHLSFPLSQSPLIPIYRPHLRARPPPLPPGTSRAALIVRRPFARVC
jgi:hypothetical protein